MKKLIYTLCFIGPFAIAARAQITNGQINYEMRADEFRQTCDNDSWSNDDNIVRLTLGGDGNSGGTTSWNTAGSGTCAGAYVRYWSADAPSNTSAPNTLLYTATGRTNATDAITLNIQSWESDNGFNCTPVSGDDCRWGPNGYTVTFKSAAKTPCRWWGRNGTADNSDFVSGGQGDARIKTVWRYTQGNACGNALNFGTLGSGTTYSHVNSNRGAPGGASASMGYTSSMGNTSAEVYYQFTLSSPANVVISTNNAGTNYDTYLRLYNSTSCGTEIAADDDGGGGTTSKIDMNLCAGTYVILVEGFSTNAGDFNVSVVANSLAITGGTIGGITNGGLICYNTDPGAFTETAVATGVAGLSYQWEQSTTSAGSGYGDIGGATGTTYDPPALTVTTWYRRRVTDACGRVTYSNVIQVLMDNIAPAITCPSNISVNTAAGTCGATVTYTAPVGTDNCPGASTARIAGPASGSTFPVGITTVTHRVTASNGQTTDCSFTVTVTDNEAPVISCPANISVNTSPGTCGATVTYTAPVGTDNCPGATTTRIAGLGSGVTFPVGTTTVTHRVTASNGQTANCSFTVTVTDNEAPGISCPANISVNTSPGTCGATVTYTAPVGTDNCSGATTARIAGPASGSTFPVGVTTVTHRVTAANGQTTDCSFTVTVTDNEAPAISCPANISVNTAAGTCGATVTYTAPVGTDNCSGATTARIAGPASGSTFPVGVTTVTHRVTAANGQTTDCSFTVTVTDNEAPAITCPANISVNTSPGICGATVTYTAPVGTDNCSGATTARIAGLASGATFPVGTTTVTHRVTAANGQTANCSFTVTVTDNEAPAISCPANISVNTSPGTCGATVTYTAPVGTDNCSGATTTRIAGLASGATFPVGVTTVTHRVTAANGQTTDCSFTVTVTDNEAPVITCPANISVNTSPGTCGATVTYTAPVGTDNCSGATTARIAGLASGATFPVGTTTVTHRVTAANGQTTDCSFTVTVTDNEAPTISCPANITVCSSNPTVTYTAPVGTDNCSGSVTTQTAGLPSGSVFPLGTTTNTFSVSNNGQTGTCSFTVTVVTASVAPTSVSGGTAICPGGSATLSVTGGSLSPGAVWEWFSGSCGGTPVGTGSSITVSPAASTDYYVRASANGSCAASSCQSATVTVSTGGSSLAVDLSTKTCRVRNNNYVHFYDGSGRLILSVNSNGQDLGDVDVTAFVNAGGNPIDVQACGSSLPQYRAASLGRHWKVTPQIQPTGPVSVRLYFDAAEETAMAASANANTNPDDDYVGLGDMDLSKYSNPGNPAVVDGSFTNNCSGGSTTLHLPGAFGNTAALFPGFSVSSRYTEYSFTGFSELWLSGTGGVSPLPIELTAFAGTCEQAKVFLSWTTASEINNERFVLERSANLAEWTTVGELPGAGNSNQPRSYQFTDERPLNGLSYYRLTQYDYDGASETFPAASVLCQSKGPDNHLSVHPNPASDRFTVTVEVEKATEAVLEILDMTGKSVLRKNLNLTDGENLYTFDRTGMPSGQYFIRVKAPGIVLKPIKLIVE